MADSPINGSAPTPTRFKDDGGRQFAMFPTTYPAIPSDKAKPPTGDDTGKQAMQFQPSNSAFIGGIVGYFGDGLGNPYNSGVVTPYTANGYGGGGRLNPATYAGYSMNGIPVAWPGNYAYFRKILMDPSVRFVRQIAYAPELAAGWVWKASKDAPTGALEFIQKNLDPLRIHILDHMFRGDDYGWAPFQQVFEVDPESGRMRLKNLKHLLHDLTSIFVTPSGDFAGLNNNGVVLDEMQSMIYTYDAESGNLYGRGRCQNLLTVMPDWYDANQAARMYDQKVAGVFLVCHYPPGQSYDKNGQLKDNWVIAQEMLNAITAGTPIAVCNEFAGEMLDSMLGTFSSGDRTRWKIEILEDRGSRQPGFGDRLSYIDKRIARGYLVPERAAFEAQKSGSRADSESQGDVLLTAAAENLARKCAVINGLPTNPFSVVNNLLRLNWGPQAIGTVTCAPATVADDAKKFYRDIVKELLSGYPELAGKVSNISDLFAQSGMPMPSDPIEEGALIKWMDGAVAMRLPDKSGNKAVETAKSKAQPAN